MIELELLFREGHFYVVLGSNEDWVVDTGAPTSFGRIPSVALGDTSFPLSSSFMGLSADRLSELLGHSAAGLLGADILNNFDILFDAPAARTVFSTTSLAVEGETVPLAAFMGIPIVETQINGATRSMFFDTGAQVSYFQDASLASFPEAGAIQDFYPGVGAFETDTHWVEMTLGTTRQQLRCGSLPGMLGAMLTAAGTCGIIGNEIMRERVLGYFPRRRQMALGAIETAAR